MTFTMNHVPPGLNVVLHYDHDFNHPRNAGGFHEVIIDTFMPVPQRGDIVEIGDSDYKQRGRVRCLVMVVEDIE